jgi:exonuclease VII small subunit
VNTLEDAIAELENAAARLRRGEIEPDEAAALVERCAELASRVGTELDRRAASDPIDVSAEQERLL